MNRPLAECVAVALAVTLGGCASVPAIGTASGSPARTLPTSAPMTPTPSANAVTPKPASSSSPAPSVSGDLVTVLEVRCGPGAPDLGSGRVRASRDGVRMRITGTPGWSLGVTHESGHESVALAGASQELVLRVAPGDVTVDCGDSTLPGLPPASALRIEDPDGWYRPVKISDGVGSCVSASAEYGQSARGKATPPVQQAQAMLHGLEAGDVVERAGYASDTGLVRVVRAGAVIGVLDFNEDGHGGWLLMGSSLCDNLSAR